MLVDDRAQSMVQPELEAGEQVLWVGQPKPSRIALRDLPLFIPGIGCGTK